MVRVERNAGFSLVEIMVGMVIGLLGVIIIMQLFAVAEGQKRTTTSGADAQTNGNIALYTIERDARQAGYGMDLAGLGACTINTTLPGNPSLTLASVIITDGDGKTDGSGNTLPDQIRVFYSTNTMTGTPQLSTAPPTSGGPNLITSTLSFKQPVGGAGGDMVIYFQAGNCALAQVANVASTTSFTQNNLTTGAWPIAANATVYNFGPMSNRTYSIDDTSNYSTDTKNRNLQVLDLVTGLTTPVAGEIVNLQAEYGKDTNADGIVDTWDTNTPPVGVATPNPWAQIIAVRIAILARSGQYEKPNPAGVCTATPVTAPPTWTGGNIAVPGGLPSCYRYKVFETVVPIRNIIWG